MIVVPALENTSNLNGYVTEKKIVQLDAMNGSIGTVHAVKQEISSRKCLWSFRPKIASQKKRIVLTMINAALATASMANVQMIVVS